MEHHVVVFLVLDHNTVGQPDNAEYLLKPSQVTVEACLAVHNDWYDDGIRDQYYKPILP